MFKIGFAEILLFVIIFFLIAPMEIPKVVRKIGELLGTFKKMRKEWKIFENNEDIKNIQTDLQEMQREFHESGLGRGGGRQGGGPQGGGPRENEEERHFEMDVQKHAKLLALGQAKQNYDFAQSFSLLRLLFDNARDVRENAARVLVTEPILGLERREEDFILSAPSMKEVHNPFEGFFARERVNQFTHYFAGVPLEHFKAALPHIAELPGIGNLDLDVIFQGKKQELRGEFDKHREEFRKKRYPRQITISPSYKCNLNCSYCFSHDLLDRYQEDMPIERFREILNEVNVDGDLERVSLFGGEPTIFPKLQDFITELEDRNLTFYFATNGLTPPETMDAILKRRTLGMVTFHVERDEFYTEEQLELLMENMEKAARSQIKIVLRYNMQDPEKTSWEFLDKYRMILPEFIFSFGLVFPSSSGENTHISLHDMRAFKEKILLLIRYIVDRPYSRNYKIVFAKPFPLCFFRGEELAYVFKNTIVKNVCEINQNGNTNNIIFNPDGTYNPCMALISEKYQFDPAAQLDKLPSEYYEKLKDLQKTALLPECLVCSLHSRGICQAACYAYTV